MLNFRLLLVALLSTSVVVNVSAYRYRPFENVGDQIQPIAPLVASALPQLSLQLPESARVSPLMEVEPESASVSPIRGEVEPESAAVTPIKGEIEPESAAVTPIRSEAEPESAAITPIQGEIEPESGAVGPILKDPIPSWASDDDICATKLSCDYCLEDQYCRYTHSGVSRCCSRPRRIIPSVFMQ